MTQIKSGGQGRGGEPGLCGRDSIPTGCLQQGPHHRLLTREPAFQRVHGLNVVLLA